MRGREVVKERRFQIDGYQGEKERAQRTCAILASPPPLRERDLAAHDSTDDVLVGRIPRELLRDRGAEVCCGGGGGAGRTGGGGRRGGEGLEGVRAGEEVREEDTLCGEASKNHQSFRRSRS